MRTLYLRNVPDEVVHRLEVLARQAGTSVAAGQDRAALPAAPDCPPEILVDDLAAGRAQR